MAYPEDVNKNPSVIVLATSGDTEDILHIEEKSWVATYPNEKEGITKEDIQERFSEAYFKKRSEGIKQEIQSGKHIFKIIKQNGKVIAYSHLLNEEEFNDFVELYILPEHQGEGTGKLLTIDALKHFGETKSIRLEVAPYNQRAIRFYQRYGFVENPSLKQSYGEDWNVLSSGMKIPVIFMEKRLK